jgi:hypothetical protein
MGNFLITKKGISFSRKNLVRGIEHLMKKWKGFLIIHFDICNANISAAIFLCLEQMQTYAKANEAQPGRKKLPGK